MTHRQDAQGRHPLGRDLRQALDDARAPVVPDEMDAVDLEPGQQLDQVADVLGRVVPLDALRPAGGAEAPQGRSDSAVPGRGQGRHLVAPEMVAVGETVHQQDGRSFAAHLDVEGHLGQFHTHHNTPFVTGNSHGPTPT